MSRTRRMLEGTGLGYLHQTAIMVVGLWLTPFLLRRIGQHDLGLWLVAGQLLGYLGLLDLGVIVMLPREVAYASGQESDGGPQRIAAVLAQVRRIVRRQLPALVVVCVLMLGLLPNDWIALRPALAVVMAAFVVLYPLRVSLATLQGLQDLPYLAKTQLFAWVLNTIVTIGLILAGAGLYALVAGWVIGQAVPALIARRRLRQQRPALSQTRAATAGEPGGSYFRRSLWVSVGRFAQALLAGSDVLIIGKMLGPAAVVPYACTGKLVTVFANHPELLMQTAQPALSELRASETKERLAAVAGALTQVMLLMSGGLAVVILAVNQSFVRWWVGAEQYGGWSIGLAFVTMMLLRHWNVATVFTLFCFGYERQISLTSLADGLLTVTLGAIFIRWWGAVGAPLGAAVGVALVSLPMNLRAVAREMNLSPGAFLLPLRPFVLRFVPVAVTAALASSWVAPASPLPLLALALSTAGLYGAVMFPLAWNGPAAPYLKSALSRFSAGRLADVPDATRVAG